MGYYPCNVTNDPDMKLSWPHYSDPTWNSERTVYGTPKKGLFYNYSDRIYSTAASDAAKDSGKAQNTAGWWKAYLEAFHGKPVDLQHIMAGSNRSNGYPYWVLGYTY